MISPVIEGRYIIIKEIYDRGGMAIVSKVYDTESDTIMAVKKAHTYHTYIKQESLAWIKLDGHPNIATFYYYRNNLEGKPLLHYSFVDGHNLRIWAENNSIISQTNREKENTVLKVISVAAQFSSAMCVAHKQNIFHLDLKMENILVKEKESSFPLVSLIDFGIYVKDKHDEKELKEIIGLSYFKDYRKESKHYTWPSDKEIKICHFYNCDIESFVEIINNLILNLGFCKEEFLNILKSIDKSNKVDKSEILSAILDNKSQELFNVKFCKIHDEISLMANQLNGYNGAIVVEDKLDKEAVLVNQAISLLYIDGSIVAKKEAKEKLEKAISLKIPNSKQLYSKYNYKLLLYNQGCISWRNLVHFKQKEKIKLIEKKNRPYLLDFFLTLIYQTQICIALGYPNYAWKFMDKAKEKGFENMNIMHIWGVDHFIRAKYYDLYGLLYLFRSEFKMAKSYFQKAINLVGNYWLYKIHLAISIVKSNTKKAEKSIIDNLLKEVIANENIELQRIISYAYNIKDINPEILLRYISNLSLNAKYLSKINSPLLPTLNYIFDMSTDYQL